MLVERKAPACLACALHARRPQESAERLASARSLPDSCSLQFLQAVAIHSQRIAFRHVQDTAACAAVQAASVDHSSSADSWANTRGKHL